MKLSFNEATCMKRSDTETDIRLCEKYGYDQIELRLDMLQEYLKTNSLNDLRKLFDSLHIEPYAFNSIEDINFNDQNSWGKLIDLFKFACEASQAINNPYIVIVPTVLEQRSKYDEKEVFEDSVESINKLLEIAKPYGVKLSFEPIGDRRWVCNTMRQALEIVEAIDSEDLGLSIDSFNVYLADKCSDINFLEKIDLSRIFVYHIVDCEDLPLGILDHCHRLIPGDGIVPIRKFSDILKKKGFTDGASVELFRPEYWDRDPEDVIKECAEKIRPFL
ncbi:MAG: sugar phosphate isomerase/epimerase [Bacillota bacterium]|jgi:2-keto-myo-inositol isomerase|nr:sugar phosphate isomerase/epimerase [Bacillota bacterium]